MQQNKRDLYLLKNTVIFFIGNFGTKLINFFMVPLYTSVLAADAYGTVDLIYTVVIILMPVLTCNIAESILRFPLDKNADYSAILNTGLVMLLICSVVGLLIFPVTSLLPEIAEYSTYIYLYIVFSAVSQVFLCYLRGKERLIEYSLGSIIYSLSIGLFNVLFLIVLKKGIEGYLTTYIVTNIITSVYAFFAGDLWSDIKKLKIDISLSRQMICYSTVLIPNTFMWWIIDSSSRIFLTGVIGVAASGIYAVSCKMPGLLMTVIGVFNQAWAYSAIRENESKDIVQYTNLVYNRLASLVILAAAGMMVIVKPFLGFYVSEEYRIAWRYTPYLIIGCVFQVMGTFLATQYTVYKDSKGFLFSASIGAFVNLLLCALLINRIGITGAAIAACMSHIAIFVYRSVDTQKYIKLKLYGNPFIIGIVGLIVMALTMLMGQDIGQILLCFEFVILAILFRETISKLAYPVIGRFLRGQCRK